jgi:hypothetical protein
MSESIFDPVLSTFARPANETPYAIGDSISTEAGAVGYWDLLPRGITSGYLIEVLGRVNQAAWTARIRLHLYDVAPPAIADNAALTLLWADRAKRIGRIDVGNFATAGTGSDMASGHWLDVPKRIHLPTRVANAGRLYYRAECLDIQTPASGVAFEFIATAAKAG